MGDPVALVIKRVILAGLNPIVPVYVEPSADGNVFVNSGRVFIHVIAGGATIAVTIDSPTPCNYGGVEIHDVEITDILTTEERMIGPFPQSRFNDASGEVLVTCTPQAGVKIAAIEVP